MLEFRAHLLFAKHTLSVQLGHGLGRGWGGDEAKNLYCDKIIIFLNKMIKNEDLILNERQKNVLEQEPDVC